MSRLRVGVIGGGFMARTHIGAARAANANVVGLVSSSPERSQQVAKALNVHGFSTLEELIDVVDVIHVCSPNSVHAQQVSLVLDAGKHVVCEKPLAVTFEEASALTRQAGDVGVVATVPFVYRFHPMVREARNHIASGALGRLLTVRGAYLQDWMVDADTYNWRVDAATGGVSRAFGDIGSHLVDLLEFISADRIARLTARTTISHPQRSGTPVLTEDSAMLIVEMASGALGSLMVSQVNAGRKNALSLELSGTDTNIFFEQEHPDELWIGGGRSSRIVSRDAGVLSPDAARLSRVPVGHPMGYLDAFAAFVSDTYAQIAGEVPQGLPTFADGARANQLTDAVLNSAQSGQWIEVNV